MNVFPFADISGLELPNIFETGHDKLKNIINNSKLPKHINSYHTLQIQYQVATTTINTISART